MTVVKVASKTLCEKDKYGNGRMLQFNFSDIGKTVFLTESDAKVALEEMQKGSAL